MSLRPAIKFYNNYGSKLITGPVAEPVTAAQLSAYLRLGDYFNDNEAEDLITEARSYIEQMTNFAFLTQTWEIALDCWPAGKEAWWDGTRQAHINTVYSGVGNIILPVYPLQSVTSVTTYDEDSTATEDTTLSDYDVDTYRRPGRMTLKRGATYPVALRANNAIIIRYVAGYEEVADIPAILVRAIKALAAYLYTNRGDCVISDAYKDSGAEELVNSYKTIYV